ncbi:MAG TPA: PD-(D/E)XK nuclease family protein [Thermoleophilia bacterium]|nr:PD-(D/E)XK nuclease family protein [Thermoleophilia bacterium]
MGPEVTAGSAGATVVVGRFAELEDALCERVLELKRGRPLEPLVVVVGSAAVRTRTRDLLIRRLGAVANVSVVTFERLGRDLVTRARGAPPVVLGGLARERLLRRLVAERAARGLEYYGPVSARPHFAQALAATFDDLRQALVDPGSGWATVAIGGAARDAVPVGAAADPTAAPGASAAAPTDDERRTRRARAADLEALYAAYCGELASRGVLDAAQVSCEAARATRDDPLPGRVILYGLYDVNCAQEALVVALLKRGADLLVPLPHGGDEGLATALAAVRALEVEVHRTEAPPVTRDLERLAAVWSATEATPPIRLELVDDGTLAVVSVADERGEAREATRVLLGAAGRGVPFWDCAVVVPHGDDVERLAAAFEGAGIPVACGLPDRSEGARVLRRLVECLAPEAGRPFARRAVVDLLVAAPLRVPPAPRETALWLDEARQAGVIAGLEEWAERLALRRSDLRRRCEREQQAAEALTGGDEVESPSLLQLRAAATGSLAAAVATLRRACAALPAEASWEEWAEGLGAVAEMLFDPPVAAAARGLAGRVRALGVLGEEVDAGEAAAVVRELLASHRVPVGRATRDGVAIVTPLELRGHRFHDVVFAGLAEGGFPSRGRADPVLGDAERRRLAELPGDAERRRLAGAPGTRLPLAEQRDAESTLLFAFACEAARERLTLLVPRTDAATGRPRLPSRLVLRLASLAAGHPVKLDEFLAGAPLRPVWRRTGATPGYEGAQSSTWTDEREFDTAALLALSASRRGRAREYLSAVLGDAAAAERRLGQWRAGRSPELGAWDSLLGRDARAALAGLGERHPLADELHPTRLERYVGCPFAFFVRDVLGLEAPEEPGESLEIEPLEFGSLAHGILERAYGRVIDDGLDRDGALAAVAAAWEERCADAERRGVTGAALAWAVRREMLLEDLLRSVSLDPVFLDRGERPIAVELRFGARHDRVVSLALPDGREVRFAGRLDRVDETPRGARVVDYKTGGGSTERERIKRRLSVQLPVYQLAVRQTMGETYEGVTSLYRLITRKGGFEELELDGDEPTARARLSALVAEVAEGVEAGLFPRTSHKGCDYCDIGYACGFSSWARARKREHERLAGLVRLQTEGPEEVATGEPG